MENRNLTYAFFNLPANKFTKQVQLTHGINCANCGLMSNNLLQWTTKPLYVYPMTIKMLIQSCEKWGFGKFESSCCWILEKVSKLFFLRTTVKYIRRFNASLAAVNQKVHAGFTAMISTVSQTFMWSAVTEKLLPSFHAYVKTNGCRSKHLV